MYDIEISYKTKNQRKANTSFFRLPNILKVF